MRGDEHVWVQLCVVSMDGKAEGGVCNVTAVGADCQRHAASVLSDAEHVVGLHVLDEDAAAMFGGELDSGLREREAWPAVAITDRAAARCESHLSTLRICSSARKRSTCRTR